MILKWGGELTPAGRQQAEELGKVFRCIYPGGAGEYGSLPGSGFLRLHSTYRHDLKVYASDEGRVQMTAAAFVKVCCLSKPVYGSHYCVLHVSGVVGFRRQPCSHLVSLGKKRCKQITGQCFCRRRGHG